MTVDLIAVLLVEEAARGHLTLDTAGVLHRGERIDNYAELAIGDLTTVGVLALDGDRIQPGPERPLGYKPAPSLDQVLTNWVAA